MIGSKLVDREKFSILIEVVPPAGPDGDSLLADLESLAPLDVDGFNVATNPGAHPRMSAMAFCSLIQQRTARPAILHCTPRDNNRISLQGLLWGARALGIETVMIMSGDGVAAGSRDATTTLRDMDIFNLLSLARESGLHAGVVFDPLPENGGLDQAIERLDRKTQAGAQFVVTQPVYDEKGVDMLARATERSGLPVIMGILPLRTPRHADFLHTKVSGVVVPAAVRDQMHQAPDPIVASAWMVA